MPNRLSIPLAALLLATGLLVLGACSSTAPNDPNEEEWHALFNGENLEGWHVQIAGYPLDENYGNTFRVEDGILKVRYNAYDSLRGRYGHLISDTSFSYYKVRAEYRFVGEQVAGGDGWARRNNGIMVHSQSAQTMTEAQDYPISIEVQLLGGLGEGERTTANLCTPGTHVVMDGELTEQHCINSASETYHGDQWVTAEAIVLGDSLITHVVEGDTVMSYTEPQIGGGVVNDVDPAVKEDGKLLTEGHIAVQSESHPTDFRSIEVLNLAGCTDPEAANYKAYYVKHVAGSCRY